MKKANDISTVVKSGLCSGCGLCSSVASPQVQMHMSDAGYLRPQVKASLTAQQQAQVAASCPGMRIEHDAKTAPYDPIWGPLVGVGTGYSTDAEVRHKGSSGGGISALALYLLETGKVNFIAQIATSKTDPLKNELQLSRTRADVLHAAGSRYAPSAPLARIKELLDTGETFAFVGKPCDVAALRQFGRTDARVAKQVPYMMSFMCAGIPSHRGTLELLDTLGVTPNDVKTFRYRGDGWPGKARVVTHAGAVKEMDYNASWGTILNRHLQFRCKICPDGTGEFADVVCADAWYGKDGYPDFEEREGRSLMLSRTAAGEQMIKDAIAAGYVIREALDVKEISGMQPYQVNRKQMVLARLLGTRFRQGVAPRYINVGLMTAARQTSFVPWLRSLVGTYKRALGEQVE